LNQDARRGVLPLALAVFFAARPAAARQAGVGSALQIAAVATQPAGAASATITFDFSRDVPGAPVPKYLLVVHKDGTGSYGGEAAPPQTRYAPAASSAPIPFQRDLRLTAATTARLFDLAAQLNYFNRPCASKARNMADTGTKTVSYAGPDGSGSCTYNFTEIKELVTLTQMMQGIAETMDEGRELDRLHRYDRLGLDAAMTFLAQEAAEGRALELQTIADTLRSIAEDSDVLARVRAKASALRAQAGAEDRTPPVE
jgi:hypothetical protein